MKKKMCRLTSDDGLLYYDADNKEQCVVGVEFELDEEMASAIYYGYKFVKANMSAGAEARIHIPEFRLFAGGRYGTKTEYLTADELTELTEFCSARPIDEELPDDWTEPLVVVLHLFAEVDPEDGEIMFQASVVFESYAFNWQMAIKRVMHTIRDDAENMLAVCAMSRVGSELAKKKIYNEIKGVPCRHSRKSLPLVASLGADAYVPGMRRKESLAQVNGQTKRVVTEKVAGKHYLRIEQAGEVDNEKE